jgi:hypothetical protein
MVDMGDDAEITNAGLIDHDVRLWAICEPRVVSRVERG